MALNARQKASIRLALVQACVYAAALSGEEGMTTQVLYGRGGSLPPAIHVLGLYTTVIARQRAAGRRFRVLRTFINGQEQ